MTFRSSWTFCAVFTAAAIIGILIWTSRQGTIARAELVRVYEQVQLGATKSQVKKLFSERPPKLLRLVESGPDTLFIQSPLEWGAANWIMWIEFSADRVIAVKVRLHDDRGIKPKDAPPDKI